MKKKQKKEKNSEQSCPLVGLLSLSLYSALNQLHDHEAAGHRLEWRTRNVNIFFRQESRWSIWLDVQMKTVNWDHDTDDIIDLVSADRPWNRRDADGREASGNFNIDRLGIKRKICGTWENYLKEEVHKGREEDVWIYK